MAKFLGLGRPTIQEAIADELYGTERALIDAQAKLTHARTIMGHHEVNVRELGIRRNQLRAEIERLNPAKIIDPAGAWSDAQNTQAGVL